MSKIYPVLLAGGSGTRLWPLSRKSYPKQFSKLIGEITLFQTSAQRLTSSDIIEFAPHITLTNSEYRFIVAEQLQEIGIDPGPILIEPEAKNTAAAILSASLYARSVDKDAIMLVAPSDHIIPDTTYFHESIKVGLSQTQNAKIVTFGIKPTHPETGYGYLEISKDKLDSGNIADIIKFVEKPDIHTANQMLKNGNFLWNAGIFLFRAKDMIDLFKSYQPNTLKFVSDAIDNARSDLGFLRLAEQPWMSLKNISIDYAIMQQARNLVAVSFGSKWSDLGGWDAVWAECNADQHGNVLSGSAHAIECSDSLLRSENTSQQVVGIGLNGIMAIAMPDAVLVAQKDHAQDVKKAVELLKTKSIPQAEVYPRDHRPWGWFESLTLDATFQVKRLFVKPGASLSLQSHKFRSEHWIVVSGCATVVVDDDVYQQQNGTSTFIPQGSKHRLSNFTDKELVIIEIQVGTYFGEDDIVRYDDRYERTS